MPENPEVHINYELLKKATLKKELVSVNLISGKYIDKAHKFESASTHGKLNKTLPSKIIDVGIRGKFVWVVLENGWTIGFGFGMTGRLTKNEEADHIRVQMDFKGTDSLYYVDPRNFGNWYFWSSIKDLEKKLGELGPDLLDNPDLDKKTIVDRFRKFNKQQITQAITSQKVLAGAGVYLKSEALYDAKIWPYAKVSDLTDKELYDLYKSLVKIAQASYKRQITWSERKYEDYQAFMKIYNKKTDPLGHKIIAADDTKDKRTTYYVKEIQIRGKK